MLLIQTLVLISPYLLAQSTLSLSLIMFVFTDKSWNTLFKYFKFWALLWRQNTESFVAALACSIELRQMCRCVPIPCEARNPIDSFSKVGNKSHMWVRELIRITWILFKMVKCLKQSLGQRKFQQSSTFTI